MRFSENFDGRTEPLTKPRIRDFKNPIIHTLLIASTAYMALNAVWYSLEYEHVEEDLRKESLALEQELQSALDDAQRDLLTQRSWGSIFSFWRK